MTKKIIYFILIISVASFSCKSKTKNEISESKETVSKLNVYYFHATIRCATCIAVEQITEKVLNENFKNEIDNKIINFKVFNIEDKENQTITLKYKISYATLLLIKSNGQITDYSDIAFQYAHTDPDKYEKLLKAEINNLLNN